MASLVSVIIVTWNGREHLARCLPAVLDQTYRPLEVLVVDNGSTDGTAALIEGQFPTVRLLRAERNLGFAAANNRGLVAAGGRLIATLNNDTIPDATWLAELVGAMGDDPSIGSCASKLVRLDQPAIIDSAGITLDRLGIAWDRNGGKPDPSETEPSEVFGACAGAALYRRELFDDIGCFDEAFFMYLEDVDLAWRARLAGWRCLYVPRARVQHAHSATAVEGSPFKERLLGRNKLWTIVKNYPASELPRYLPAIVAYDLGACLYALVWRRNPNPFRGRLAAIRGIGRMIEQRRQIQTTARTSGRALRPQLAPVESPARVLARYRHLRPATSHQSEPSQSIHPGREDRPAQDRPLAILPEVSSDRTGK